MRAEEARMSFGDPKRPKFSRLRRRLRPALRRQKSHFLAAWERGCSPDLGTTLGHGAGPSVRLLRGRSPGHTLSGKYLDPGAA